MFKLYWYKIKSTSLSEWNIYYVVVNRACGLVHKERKAVLVVFISMPESVQGSSWDLKVQFL